MKYLKPYKIFESSTSIDMSVEIKDILAGLEDDGYTIKITDKKFDWLNNGIRQPYHIYQIDIGKEPCINWSEVKASIEHLENYMKSEEYEPTNPIDNRVPIINPRSNFKTNWTRFSYKKYETFK